jgi:hypothetical protein
MARPGKCARCSKHTIYPHLAEQVCIHCRVLIMHYSLHIYVDAARLNHALNQTKPWTHVSKHRFWEVINGRIALGQQTDRFLAELFMTWGVPIPVVYHYSHMRDNNPQKKSQPKVSEGTEELAYVRHALAKQKTKGKTTLKFKR